jgi:hypothetical protein
MQCCANGRRLAGKASPCTRWVCGSPSAAHGCCTGAACTEAWCVALERQQQWLHLSYTRSRTCTPRLPWGMACQSNTLISSSYSVHMAPGVAKLNLHDYSYLLLSIFSVQQLINLTM